MSQASEAAAHRTARAQGHKAEEPVVTSGVLIMPGDDNTVASLKKQLSASLRTPQQRRFDELKAQGFDSETAMDLANFSAEEIHSPEGANTILAAARQYGNPPGIGYEVTRTATYEVPSAMRTIGAASGAAVGSAMGMSAVRYVAKNSRMFGIGAAVLGIGLATVFTGKIVAASLGKVAAGIAVANIISASGIVIAAVLTRRG